MQFSQTSLGCFACRFPTLVSALALVTAATALLAGTTGCAIHYGNQKRGVETVWGVGRVTWESEQLTNGWTTVSSGTRLPGIVLGVGPDFLGIALGYQVRERLVLAPPMDPAEWRASVNGREIDPTTGHRWAVGRIALRTSVLSPVAVVSGRAGAGVGLGLENGRPAAAVGWQSRQLTTVHGMDAFIELTMPMCPWPHFDYPSSEVIVIAATNLTLRGNAP